MKIAIGTQIKKGPWGGGNSFAVNLKDYLLSKGHNVVHQLIDEDIDIILMTDPRKTSETSSINRIEIKRYLKYVNNHSLVFHRINECDERRGTDYINKFYIDSNKVADVTIFVSKWLKQLFINQGIQNSNLKVIKAGANNKYFNSEDLALYNKNEKLKIVTHHWGTNMNKGFEVYKKIDKILEDLGDSSYFSFTFIGNLPKNVKFKNIEVIDPIEQIKVGEVLKKYNLYLTASINEPSGNHHIEAMSCGLPVMYIESGGTTEYCEDYGIKYSESNVEDKIKHVWENYKDYAEKVKHYKFNSDMMCQEYLNLFKKTNKKESFIEDKHSIKHRILSYLYKNYLKLYKLQNVEV